MPETIGGFEITSGGVCRRCRYERLVLVADSGICLTCAIDEQKATGAAHPMHRVQTRRSVRAPVATRRPPQHRPGG